MTLFLSLSCLAEALHGPCPGLSGQGSVWQAVPKGHPRLLFWQLLAITDVPDGGWRHHCTLLGCPSGAAAVGWRLPQTEGIQGTPILPESPLPYRAELPGALSLAPHRLWILPLDAARKRARNRVPQSRLLASGTVRTPMSPSSRARAETLLECAWSKRGLREPREPAVHTAC